MTLGEAIKKVRKDLKKNQVEFAKLLGCRHNTVSRYELNQLTPSAFSLQGLINLSSGHEREIFIEELERQKGPACLKKMRSRLPRRPLANQHSQWHDLLDKILASGDPDAIIAVTNNLVVFGRYVDQRQSPQGNISGTQADTSHNKTA